MINKSILYLLTFLPFIYLQSFATDTNLAEIQSQARLFQNYALSHAEDSSSLEVYPLRESAGAIVDEDDLDEFAEELDQKFFQYPSKKSVIVGALAGLAGAVVPHPSCGYIISNIGDFLDVPISSIASTTLISGITITTTVAFTQQFYSAGKKIISCIFREEPFQEESYWVNLNQKNKLHYLFKSTLLLSSGINALIPTILMREAEKEFPVFFAFTVFPFYAAWFENNYKVGASNLDYLFLRYHYSSKLNFQKRDLLKKAIRKFQGELRQDDYLVQCLHKIIKQQRKNHFRAQQGVPFCFSGFFMRDTVRLEEEGKLLNFKIDMEKDPHSLLDNALDWGSSFLTGASIYTKYSITQSVLEGLMKEALDEQTSFILSSTLATFEALHRIANFHHFQTEALQSFRHIFQPQKNMVPLRKIGGIIASVNATLFSLPHLVAGIKIFPHYSTLDQVMTLGPTLLYDYLYYEGFFSKNYNRFISNASTLTRPESSVVLQRAHLIKHTDKALKYIDDFDTDTVEKLYSIVMKGV